jgi:hypothetical protein
MRLVSERPRPQPSPLGAKAGFKDGLPISAWYATACIGHIDIYFPAVSRYLCGDATGTLHGVEGIFVQVLEDPVKELRI